MSHCELQPADISLSLWHVAADGRTYGTGCGEKAGDALQHHSAFVAKEVGDYTDARRHARRALAGNPFGRHTWRLFGLTLFGSHQIRWIPLTKDLKAIRNAMPFADPERQPTQAGFLFTKLFRRHVRHQGPGTLGQLLG